MQNFSQDSTLKFRREPVIDLEWEQPIDSDALSFIGVFKLYYELLSYLQPFILEASGTGFPSVFIPLFQSPLVLVWGPHYH